MLATFIFEFSAALYILWRYKLNPASRLIVLILLALGTFQLAEYNVCGGYGLTASHWSRIGYVAIGTLPPLGLHLLHVLGGSKRRAMVWLAYASMMAFDLLFLLVPSVFNNYLCTGNYVIFQLDMSASIAYGTYYYGWLAAALGTGWYWLYIRRPRLPHQAALTVRALLVGYLVFLVPTGLANSIDPTTRRGIPSIMCGFAVFFALILVVFIIPKVSQHKKHHQQ